MRGLSVSEAEGSAQKLAVDAQRQPGASMKGTVVLVEAAHVMLKAADGGSFFKLSLADVVTVRAIQGQYREAAPVARWLRLPQSVSQ